MSGFYADFEARHRGSREDIKSRLWVYGPFLADLKAVRERPAALDLGCGRGEWLEILRETGIEARGVDLDGEMVEACAREGLAAARGDAIAALREAPDASLDLVTAFHLAEHLPFEQVRELVAEALRALRPAGLLILETPNPENLAVGSSRFYLDPTHVRPLPPGLLAFVPEHAGFLRTKVMRLQEPAGVGGDPFPPVGAILTGVSPDYAVVAQKGGPPGEVGRLDVSFDRHYGVSLEDLIGRHDRQRAHLDATVESRLGAIEVKAHEAHALAAAAQARAAGADERAVAAEARAAAAETAILQMVESASWKVTAPLRAAAAAVKRLLGR